MEINITLNVEPNPKARAVTVAKKGRVWSFTPKKTKVAEDELKLLIKQQITQSFPAYTPVKMIVVFYRSKPKSSMDAMPVRKPDLDNYIKSISDSLNTLAFPDDAQITTLVASKRWTEKLLPYIRIKIVEDIV